MLSNESPLGRFFGHLGDIVIVNFLFVLTCIPVITIGPALCGMNFAFLKRRRASTDSIAGLYIEGFRSNFRQSLPAWLIMIAIYIFTIGDIFATAANGAAANTPLHIFFIVMFAIAYFETIYLFAVIPAFNNSLKNLFAQAFFLAASHMVQTLIMAVFPAALAAVAVSGFFAFTFLLSLMLLFGFGLINWCYSFLYIRMFESYLD